MGLNQILKAVGVPKGSFYHHFASKEEFGVELLRYYAAEASTCFRERLLRPNLDSDPIDRLLGFFEGGIAKFQENDAKCPCLIIKLAAEVSSFSENMRVVLAEGFENWVHIYESVLDQAKEEGLLPDDFDSTSNAELIQDLWCGATQRAIICKSIKPLRNALNVIKSRLATPALT